MKPTCTPSAATLALPKAQAAVVTIPAPWPAPVPNVQGEPAGPYANVFVASTGTSKLPSLMPFDTELATLVMVIEQLPAFEALETESPRRTVLRLAAQGWP